jgi:prophage regulatory protein
MSDLPIILRRKQVEEATGYSRSTIYLRISLGLFPRPVQLGSRMVGWPQREIAAINGAFISGRSDAEIRALVTRLEEARRGVEP